MNFNTTLAGVWGRQEAEFAKKGCLMRMPDSFIAATARRHNLTLITRNTSEYDGPGIKVINPFWLSPIHNRISATLDFRVIKV